MQKDDKSPIEVLTERITKLEADVRAMALPLSECDFTIKRDPKSAKVSFSERNLSEVNDEEYLWHLSNYLDWQGFTGAKSQDDKQRKFAPYRHLEAAKVRRFKAELYRKMKAKKSMTEAPF